MFFENFYNFFLVFFKEKHYNKAEGNDMETKMCILDETKECDGCLECEVCDLDPNKICDNCGKCLDIKEFATIKIDKIYTDPDEYHEK